MGATLVVEDAGARDERHRGALTVVGGSEAGRVFPLQENGMMSIGRATDNDLCFDDASVSGTHAQVARIGGVYVLVDMRSTNGTFVNDMRLQVPTELKDGDRIRLGKSAIVRFTLMTAAEEEALRRVYEASLRDGLTGVFNRKHLDERLDGEIAFAVRHEAALSIAMLDIDHFKRVNDTHGHLAGDAVLKSAASVLARSLRTEDIVARYGGEEFTVVARGIDLAHAAFLGERVRQVIEQAPVTFGGQVIRVTASVGVASLACCGQKRDKPTLVGVADRRLYAAKHAGRNRVVSAG